MPRIEPAINDLWSDGSTPDPTRFGNCDRCRIKLLVCIVGVKGRPVRNVAMLFICHRRNPLDGRGAAVSQSSPFRRQLIRSTTVNCAAHRKVELPAASQITRVLDRAVLLDSPIVSSMLCAMSGTGEPALPSALKRGLQRVIDELPHAPRLSHRSVRIRRRLTPNRDRDTLIDVVPPIHVRSLASYVGDGQHHIRLQFRCTFNPLVHVDVLESVASSKIRCPQSAQLGRSA